MEGDKETKKVCWGAEGTEFPTPEDASDPDRAWTFMCWTDSASKLTAAATLISISYLLS